MEEKIVINAAEGTNEVVIRHGDAPKQLEQRAPLSVEINGTLNAVAEYLRKRISTGQFEQKDCNIVVNREKVTIALTINERDAYKVGRITGRLQYHPDFALLNINKNELWTPSELAMVLKLHRYWFNDRRVGMEIVSALMNYTADVNQKIEQSIKETGSHKDNFEQIVNSNLPDAINLSLPIFKGYKPISVDVEFFAKVDGRDVSFALLSAGALESLETARNEAIDKEIAAIREIAPDIVIIEE